MLDAHGTSPILAEHMGAVTPKLGAPLCSLCCSHHSPPHPHLHLVSAHLPSPVHVFPHLQPLIVEFFFLMYGSLFLPRKTYLHSFPSWFKCPLHYVICSVLSQFLPWSRWASLAAPMASVLSSVMTRLPFCSATGLPLTVSNHSTPEPSCLEGSQSCKNKC